IPDQFYDHTKRRVSTFFGDGLVGHVGMAHPVCTELGDVLETAARETGVRVHRGGTYICIEGPQFSTKGESEIYRRWGVSVIGMTNMPEAKLAREAELCYATLALATDYDVWHETHAAVSVEAVVANLLKNVATAKVVLKRVIPRVGKPCDAGCGDALARAGITNPAALPPRTRQRPPPLPCVALPPRRRRPAVVASAGALDVVGIGNALVDVLSQADDAMLGRQGLVKGSMHLVDEDRARALSDAMGPGVEVSGGSAANTMVGVASFGGRAHYVGKVRDDQLGEVFGHDLRATGVGYDTPRATS